jgi:hypothetical protein
VACWGEDTSSSVSSVDTCKSTSRTASYLRSKYSDGLNEISSDVGVAVGAIGPSVGWSSSVGNDEAEISGSGVGASVRALH